ncbi:MAG: antitoxin component YwqK of YwqJK toxin-antitoxin module [Arenicella sp.]|jgi:antitoxin component YwqK of YwqJK toxin-antitoxin module
MIKTAFILFTFLVSASLVAQGDINKTDSQGRKQGEWKKGYDNVKVFKYTGQFKDDKPYGEFRYYRESGSCEAIIHFSNSGKLGRSKMFHNSGYIMARGKYINQKKDSIWLYFDDRGTISYQEKWEKGLQHGQTVYYYEPKKGQLPVARYEYYDKGILDGEFKEYHENMKLKTEGNYKDGNLHGMVKHYHGNGKIKKIARYKYAVKHGFWIFYGEDGKKVGDKLYWEGKLLKGEARKKKVAEMKAAKDK